MVSMLARVPRTPLSLDPLIAEAKRRARRRRWLILALLVIGAGATVATIELRSTPRAGPAAVSAARTPSRWGDDWRVRLGVLPVVAYGASSVWAASMAPPQDFHGQLVRLDPRTGKRLATFPVGWWPSQIAVGAGGAWVADTWGDGSRVKDGIPGFANAVTRIDPAVNRVVATIRIPGVQAVTVGGGSAWATAIGLRDSRETIIRIDPATNRATTLRAIPGVNGPVVWGGSRLWALTWFADPTLHARVWEIDPQSGRVIASLVVPGIGPNAALAYRSGVLWVGDTGLLTWIRTRPRLSIGRRERVGNANDLVTTQRGIWASGDRTLFFLGLHGGAMNGELALHGWVSPAGNALAASGAHAWIVTQTATPTNVVSHLVAVHEQGAKTAR